MDNGNLSLVQQFYASPELRAGVAALIATAFMMVAKQWLPTGQDAADPTIATENRWLPMVHAGIVLGLCILGAVLTRQDVVESALWGLGSSGLMVGVMRGGKLAIEGDKTERKRAAAVRKVDKLETKVEKLELGDPVRH